MQFQSSHDDDHGEMYRDYWEAVSGCYRMLTDDSEESLRNIHPVRGKLSREVEEAERLVIENEVQVLAFESIGGELFDFWSHNSGKYLAQ